MTDPKEALERLKVDEIANEAVHQWNADGHPHLSTGAIGVARIAAEIARAGSIAEREGLEREVERLTIERDTTSTDRYDELMDTRCERDAAESKLSALEEAIRKVRGHWEHRATIAEHAVRKDRAPRRSGMQMRHAQEVVRELDDLRALLHPRERTYTQAEVDSILKAAFPKVSVAPPSQGMETEQFAENAKCPDVSGLVEGVKQVHSDLQMLAIACEKNDPRAEISIRVSDALAVIQDRIAPLIAALELAAADNNHKADCTTSGGWRPMATVPKYDGPVLLRLKDDLPRHDLLNWCGRMFVGVYQGKHSEWCFAAPVGQGGFPDEWFDGWAPLPQNLEREDAQRRATTNSPTITIHQWGKP